MFLEDGTKVAQIRESWIKSQPKDNQVLAKNSNVSKEDVNAMLLKIKV